MKKLLLVLLIIIGIPVYVNAQTTGVLCYHGISSNPLKNDEYCIKTSEFEDDLQYFINKGYSFLKPCEMWYAEGDKNIVITSDDGYEDFYTDVFPLLKKYKVKAAVFVISSMIDKTGYLKSWQIKEMHDSGLVEIGNHTHIIHRRKKDVLENWYNDTIMLNQVFYDIERCSKKVEQITGKATESIAYPYGLYTEELNNTVRNTMGFTTSFSTEHGIVKSKDDFSKPLKRIYRVLGDTPQKIEEMIELCK